MKEEKMGEIESGEVGGRDGEGDGEGNGCEILTFGREERCVR